MFLLGFAEGKLDSLGPLSNKSLALLQRDCSLTSLSIFTGDCSCTNALTQIRAPQLGSSEFLQKQLWQRLLERVQQVG